MKKVDYRKELGALYKGRRNRVDVVDVPAFNFLCVDGEGSPQSAAFSAALEALYPVAYTLKFTCKRSPDGVDFGVMPLEGLWWADDMQDFVLDRKDRWKWTLMILQPQAVTQAMVDEAVAEIRRKKNPPALGGLRFETVHEGPAVQSLHVGPFSEEGPVIQALHEHISAAGWRLAGRHHEIYLSDMRRSPPERWRTLVRQPYAT